MRKWRSLRKAKVASWGWCRGKGKPCARPSPVNARRASGNGSAGGRVRAVWCAFPMPHCGGQRIDADGRCNRGWRWDVGGRPCGGRMVFPARRKPQEGRKKIFRAAGGFPRLGKCFSGSLADSRGRENVFPTVIQYRRAGSSEGDGPVCMKVQPVFRRGRAPWSAVAERGTSADTAFGMSPQRVPRPLPARNPLQRRRGAYASRRTPRRVPCISRRSSGVSLFAKDGIRLQAHHRRRVRSGASFPTTITARPRRRPRARRAG